MKQMHQKDREDQEEELEDVRQSCQKRVCKLWPQCTQSPTWEDAGTQNPEACSFYDQLRPLFPGGISRIWGSNFLGAIPEASRIPSTLFAT